MSRPYRFCARGDCVSGRRWGGRRERAENVPADEEVGGGGGVGGDFAEAVGEADEAELTTDAFGCCGIAGEVVGEGAVCFVWVWLVAIRIWRMRC
jgi:hypothetical protein